MNICELILWKWETKIILNDTELAYNQLSVKLSIKTSIYFIISLFLFQTDLYSLLVK